MERSCKLKWKFGLCGGCRVIPTIPTLFLNVGVLVRWYMRMAVGYDGNDEGEYSEIYVQVACKIAVCITWMICSIILIMIQKQ